MAEGRIPPFAPPGTVSVVGVRDAARGTLLALERGRSGARYLLVESSLSALELFGCIARALGVAPPRRTLPRACWPAVVAGARVWDALRPMSLTPPQALTMLGLDLRFDASKARCELGWTAEPFEAVLAEMIGHLRERGRIPEPARLAQREAYEPPDRVA